VRHEVSSSQSSICDAPTAELIALALRQTGELVRAEASLATDELKEDAFGAIAATVNILAAVVLFVLAIAIGAVAISLLLGADLPTALLATSGILGVLGLAAVVVGVRLAPKSVLGRSRERVAAEIREIEDHA
jgi:hypothetical protein